MEKQDSPDRFRRIDGEAGRAEFAELLLQIEREPIPERLLGLARRLQAALRERRGAAAGYPRGG